MRREMEQRVNIDAVDIYGLSEVMGPGIASECVETKDGPVIWEDYSLPEVVDPITGDVLPDGQEGELVFISQSKEALPVIRCRTRDLTRMLPPTSRSMRRIGKITGRVDDMLIISCVNVFPKQIEELLLMLPGLAPHYRQHLVKAYVGISVKVLVSEPESLERSAGKAKRVIDKRHRAKASRGRVRQVHWPDSGLHRRGGAAGPCRDTGRITRPV